MSWLVQKQVSPTNHLAGTINRKSNTTKLQRKKQQLLLTINVCKKLNLLKLKSGLTVNDQYEKINIFRKISDILATGVAFSKLKTLH